MHNAKSIYVAFVLILGMMCISPLTFAQSSQVLGRITDQSGNVISGATVEAVNTNTQVSRTTVSNQLGYYSLPPLTVGSYTINVQAAGFQTIVRSGITLQVNQVASIDFSMQVGKVTQKVEVRASVNLVETQSSTLKEVVDERRIVSLPLNGRDPLQLILLMPGLVGTTRDRGGLRQGGSARDTVQPGIAANGARGNMVNYLLDGAPHNDTYTNVSLTMPVPDALQEFSVQTNNYSAEYGRSAGAVVNAVSRSGTNSFHGDLYEFNRNFATSAINYFDSQSDGLNRNQFGGTLGGPVYIPHVYNGRDRTFFFFSEQETRQVQTPSSENTTVLTEAQRNGDFSAYPDPIIDPETGLPFPGNQIPIARENVVTKNVLDELIPLPTEAATGQFFYSVPNTNSGRQIMVKLDQHFGSADAISFTYLYNLYSTPANVTPLVFATRPSNKVPSHNFAVNYTHIFGPASLNEFHFASNRRSAIAQPVWTTGYNDLGMQDISTNSPTHDFNLSVNGAFDVSVQEQDTTSPSDYSFADVYRLTTGKHDISLGFSYQFQNLVKNYRWLLDPAMSFEGIYTGYGVADFFLGLPTQVTQSSNGEQGDQYMPVYGAFVQDNFRVTPNLTLNLGVRWDPFIPYIDRDGRMALFRPGRKSIVYKNAPVGLVFPGDPGVPKGGTNPKLANISPRLGFAWTPFGDNKTSIRGGYGVFYDSAMMSAISNQTQDMPPYATFLTFRPTPGPFDNPYAGNNPFPLPFPPTPDSIFPSGLATGSYDPNFATPYLQAWNFIVERSIHTDWLLRVAYAGSRGSDLLQEWNLNAAVYIPGESTPENEPSRRPYAPDFSSIYNMATNGNSTYHSLQISLEKRFSQGFTILANYTLSKSLDQGSGGGTNYPDYTDNNNFDFDWGPSDFNVTHRFVASGVWDLPPLSNRSGLVRTVFGNWQASGILTAQSGMPFSIMSGEDNSLTGIGYDRADQVGDPARPSGVNPVNEWFNTQAFVPNAIGTFGNTGRNFLTGPGLFNIDMAVAKSFPLIKSARFMLRAEAFNVLNHPNFGRPSNTVTSGSFGRITSANDPRILQFGGKFIF